MTFRIGPVLTDPETVCMALRRGDQERSVAVEAAHATSGVARGRGRYDFQDFRIPGGTGDTQEDWLKLSSALRRSPE
jgi:hypothetical protein